MSLIAFSVRGTSLIKPRCLWAALNVILEKREDDWKMPQDSVSRVWPRIKLPHLHDMGSRFWEFLRQTMECFCGYDPKHRILLSPGHNATIK